MSLCSTTQAIALLQGGQRAQPPTLNKIINKSTGKKQGVCVHCGKTGGEDLCARACSALPDLTMH